MGPDMRLKTVGAAHGSASPELVTGWGRRLCYLNHVGSDAEMQVLCVTSEA